MTRRNPARSGRALGADDFAPYLDHADSRAKARDRKTGQLCAEVERTLTFLLDSEGRDEVLQDFAVEAVVPNPNAASLLVVLRPRDRSRPFELAPVLRRLSEVKGYWRGQIAGAIHRKKTPELAFQVLPQGGQVRSQGGAP